LHDTKERLPRGSYVSLYRRVHLLCNRTALNTSLAHGQCTTAFKNRRL